jgi:uncharacterized protein
MIKKLLIISHLLITSSIAQTVYQPSFNCQSTKLTNTENKICSSNELSHLDSELSKIYKSFYFLSKEIK